MAKKQLSTIGYEGVDLTAFLDAVAESGVQMLVDVRERAQSRRRGFSKTRLSASLEDRGISYVHLRELGDPKPGREAARRGDFKEFRRIYSGVLKGDPAKVALEKLEALSREYSVCLLCYERDSDQCHRRIVAERVSGATGARILHLVVDQARQAA